MSTLHELQGQTVQVYWNVRRKIWSVRVRGKVLLHTAHCTILNPRFKVSEAGRQRVLRERCKNVHAYIEGEVYPPGMIAESGRRVSYNPYKGPSFYLVGSNEAVLKGRWAILQENAVVTTDATSS